MIDILIRDLPDALHETLKLRAASHHRSISSEIRNILQTTLTPQNRVKLGDLLASISEKVGITKEDAEIFKNLRKKSPSSPVIS